MTKEQAFRAYVLAYDIDVPAERVEAEYDFFLTQAKHNLQYDTLTSGARHTSDELAAMEEDLREAALFEAKSDLVLKELLSKQDLPVTQEEREERAKQIAEKDGTPMELLYRFFGKDLSALDRDIREEKIREQIYQEMKEQ